MKTGRSDLWMRSEEIVIGCCKRLFLRGSPCVRVHSSLSQVPQPYWNVYVEHSLYLCWQQRARVVS